METQWKLTLLWKTLRKKEKDGFPARKGKDLAIETVREDKKVPEQQE